MKVNSHVIEKYIWLITNGVAASAENPMDNLENFDREIEMMKKQAEAAGDEELLKMSLDSLIANPNGRIQKFNGQVFGFREDQMVELLTYVFHYVWLEEELSLPGDGVDLEFVSMSDEEWSIRQGKS